MLERQYDEDDNHPSGIKRPLAIKAEPFKHEENNSVVLYENQNRPVALMSG